MGYMLVGCQIVLAITFLIAVIGKTRNFDSLVATLSRSTFPSSMAHPFVFALLLLEIMLAAMLLLGSPQILVVAMGASALTLISFLLWMVWVRRRGIIVQCGCFGGQGSTVGVRTIVRNGILSAVAILGFVLAQQKTSLLSLPPLWVFLFALLLSTGSIGFVLLRSRIEVLIRFSIQQWDEQNHSHGRDKTRPSYTLSRRQFLRLIGIGSGVLAGLVSITPVFASLCDKGAACNCYKQSYTDVACNCDCANHPDSYCYGPEFIMTIKHCCPPDRPVECSASRVYTGYHVFCEYCPPACTTSSAANSINC